QISTIGSRRSRPCPPNAWLCVSAVAAWRAAWLGRSRGEFHLRQFAVAVRVGAIEPGGGGDGPLLEGQQIVSVDVEGSERVGPGRQHLLAGDLEIPVAVIAKEAPLLAT